MNKHSPLCLRLFAFLVIFILAGMINPAFSQCNPMNMFVTGTTTSTPNITDVAQSFTTISECGNVQIGSITVYSTSSHSDATLKIFAGEGTGGTELFSGAVNLSEGGNATPSVMPVSPGLSVTGGQVYTFQITIPGTSGAFLNLFKSTVGNLYTGGTLYQNGVAQPDEDLFFSVNTTAEILPVELTAFDARAENGHTLLTWQTASEQNNEGFEVERSADGRDWRMIGFVNGNGTTFDVHDYFFYDEKPLAGENYYRLRQVGFTGDFEYSPVKVVRFEGVASDPVAYPNPAGAGQVLTIGNDGSEIFFIKLVGLSGRIVGELEIDEGPAAFELPVNLQKGIYFVVCYTKHGQTAEKIIVK